MPRPLCGIVYCPVNCPRFPFWPDPDGRQPICDGVTIPGSTAVPGIGSKYCGKGKEGIWTTQSVFEPCPVSNQAVPGEIVRGPSSSGAGTTEQGTTEQKPGMTGSSTGSGTGSGVGAGTAADARTGQGGSTLSVSPNLIIHATPPSDMVESAISHLATSTAAEGPLPTRRAAVPLWRRDRGDLSSSDHSAGLI